MEQLVSAKLGHDNCPNKPVHGAGKQETDTDDAVQVVRNRLVDALSIGGGNEGCRDQVKVRKVEDDDDREGCFDGGLEVGEL